MFRRIVRASHIRSLFLGIKYPLPLSANSENEQTKFMLQIVAFGSYAGLQITAGQRTMSGLIADLTGQTPVLPVILTGHFWIQTLSFPYSCRLMLYDAGMISFFFGDFCCLALNPSKKKNAVIN